MCATDTTTSSASSSAVNPAFIMLSLTCPATQCVCSVRGLCHWVLLSKLFHSKLQILRHTSALSGSRHPLHLVCRSLLAAVSSLTRCLDEYGTWPRWPCLCKRTRRA